MRHDPFFNYALDDFYSSAPFVSAVAFCFLFLAAPAFAANPPVAPTNPVGFTTITTPYSSTTSPPQISHIPPQGTPNVGGGSSYPVRPTRPITPIVSNGGFSSPASGGITITGVKSPPIPTSGTANYPKPTVNNAAKALLRNNLAGLALGAGLQALLDGIGGLIDEGGTVSRLNPPPVDPDAPHFAVDTEPRAYGYTAEQACAATVGNAFAGFLLASISSSYYSENNKMCNISGTQYDGSTFGPAALSVHGFNTSAPCPEGSTKLSDGYCDVPGVPGPFPPDQLDDAVDNSYNPDPSDFDNLTPHMFPQSYTQNPIPTINLPTVTTSATNAAGDTTTTETTTTIDFTVDNSKPIPDVETTVTENKDEFTNGNPSGSSSTSTTTPPNNNPQAPQQGTGGGTTVQFPEIPTDCDFMPTVCAFLDWFKQEPEEPDDNLSELLKEVPIVSETFTITGGAAACPAPLVLNLSQFGSREVSYQPLCDLASTMRFLYLALMSFAAAILLHRSISRV